MARKLLKGIFLFFSLAGIAYAYHGSISSLQQQIQQQINQEREVYKMGAIAVSYELAHDNHIYSSYSGTAKRHGGTRIEADGLFQVGSITKSFIAAIVLQLEQEGKLNISDPIGKFLPNYPKWRRITVRQLLNHTSGIYNYTLLPQFDHVTTTRNNHKQWTPQEIVATVYHRKLYFQPAQGYHYSNTNYILLGMLIQKVTQQAVKQELNRRLLRHDPLDLAHSYYLPGAYPHAVSVSLVNGYFENQDVTDINMSWVGAAGALVSNSIDVVRWIKQLFTGHVLQYKQLQELKTVVSIPGGKPLPNNSPHFAYGLGIKRIYKAGIGLIWFHVGATTGYTAIMVWVPEKQIALAVTTNAGDLGRKKIKRIAFNLLEKLIYH